MLPYIFHALTTPHTRTRVCSNALRRWCSAVVAVVCANHLWASVRQAWGGGGGGRMSCQHKVTIINIIRISFTI